MNSIGKMVETKDGIRCASTHDSDQGIERNLVCESYIYIKDFVYVSTDEKLRHYTLAHMCEN